MAAVSVSDGLALHGGRGQQAGAARAADLN